MYSGHVKYVVALIRRYKAAGQAPPSLIYTDTDCCSLSGPPKAAQLFHEWDHIQVNILRIMGN